MVRQSQVLAGTTGGVVTDYLYGQSILGSLSVGTWTWYGLDGQGSVRQSFDAVGDPTGALNYDPFGTPESSTVAPFGYTGQLQDGTTGNEYLRARWYQPGNGALLGVDPQLDSTGQPYAYAADDPVNGRDPSGQSADSQTAMIDGSFVQIATPYIVLNPSPGNQGAGSVVPCPLADTNTVVAAALNPSNARSLNPLGLVPSDVASANSGGSNTIDSSPETALFQLEAASAARHEYGWNFEPKPYYSPLLHTPCGLCGTGVDARIVPIDIGNQTNPDPKAGVFNGIEYHAGHLYARNLGGSDSDLRNFTAQTVNANTGSFKRMENNARRLTAGLVNNRGVRAPGYGYGIYYEVTARYGKAECIQRVRDVCIPDSFVVDISRTSIPVPSGHDDFYAMTDNIGFDATGLTSTVFVTPSFTGAMCFVGEWTFDNSTNSTASIQRSDALAPLPGYTDNRVANPDCRTHTI